MKKIMLFVAALAIVVSVKAQNCNINASGPYQNGVTGESGTMTLKMFLVQDLDTNTVSYVNGKASLTNSVQLYHRYAGTGNVQQTEDGNFYYNLALATGVGPAIMNATTNGTNIVIEDSEVNNFSAELSGTIVCQ